MARILYKITNLINGKAYIGQTKNFERRMKEHAKHRKGSAIRSAIDKYGKENFLFEKLAVCEDHMIDDAEIKAINIYQTMAPNGYNMISGGCENREFSDEIKLKMSKAKLGKTHYWSPEARKKLSESRKGIKFSKEHCESMSKCRKGKPAWNKGIPASEKEKIRLQNINKGKKLSTEHKAKISLGLNKFYKGSEICENLQLQF